MDLVPVYRDVDLDASYGAIDLEPGLCRAMDPDSVLWAVNLDTIKRALDLLCRAV